MTDPPLAIVLLEKVAGAVFELIAGYGIIQALPYGGHVVATGLFS